MQAKNEVEVIAYEGNHLEKQLLFSVIASARYLKICNEPPSSSHFTGFSFSWC